MKNSKNYPHWVNGCFASTGFRIIPQVHRMLHLGEDIPNERVFGREEIARVCWCSSVDEGVSVGGGGELELVAVEIAIGFPICERRGWFRGFADGCNLKVVVESRWTKGCEVGRLSRDFAIGLFCGYDLSEDGDDGESWQRWWLLNGGGLRFEVDFFVRMRVFWGFLV